MSDSNQETEVKLGDSKTKIGKIKYIKDFLYGFSLSVILSVTLIGSISYIFGVIFIKDDLYFSKEIKKDIKKSISNGAHLQVVKHIYEKRDIKRNLWHPFKSDKKSNYPFETSLEDILYDLQVDYFEQESADTVYFKKLMSLSLEYKETNPFDRLPENQKFLFENLRQKTNSYYSSIESDINKISNELQNKNEMVEKYLDKSTQSYWISILALIITIILPFIQLYKNRPRKV